MYNWRKMTPEQRRDTIEYRSVQGLPLHSIPHQAGSGRQYLLTAACYEHHPWIGVTPARIAAFEAELVACLRDVTQALHAHVILPNHYHALITLDVELGAPPACIWEALKGTLSFVFKIHQRTGYAWNKEDGQKGRRVWCNAAETAIKSDRQFHATVNYIHHNPVKHGYCAGWTEWPFSSAIDYLKSVGREEATKRWHTYEITEMGTWDVY